MNDLPFFGAAALLTMAVLTWLLYPLLKGGRGMRAAASRRALNAAIYRDQLAELERDRAAGNLADADYAQARDELQHRLLQDAGVSAADSTSGFAARPDTRSALALVMVLPLAAALLYAWLGNPAALRPPAVREQITAAQVEEMVAKLAARMEKNPDDLKGWMMLARSYKALHRYEEGAKAYERIMALGGAEDANVLADYADLLGVRAGGSLEGRPLELLDKALRIDPENVMALALAGSATYARQDFVGTARHWDKLLKLLPAESEDARSLAVALEDVHAKIGQGDTAAKNTAATGAGASSPKSVSGQVSLAPALAGKAQPGDTLFVFARGVDGPRMPLAVLRARVADLPLSFTLDDTQALNPQMKISGATQIKVEARISKSGNATPQPGDLSGESAAVQLGAKNVKIVIERVSP